MTIQAEFKRKEDRNGSQTIGVEIHSTGVNGLNGKSNSRLYDAQDQYIEEGQIEIPETADKFSFRVLWAFMGPGFLVSIAYLDPGAAQSDLRSGSVVKFRLLWLLFVATATGLFVQRLALRLGVVTGLNLAEMCYRMFHKLPRIFVWLMVEAAIVGSDMQEVIGAAISIYLLSSKIIPLWGGVLITVVDSLTFFFLEKYGMRKMEMLFAVLILTMAVTFGYEYSIVKADQAELFAGLVTPWCSGCTASSLTQAVGIIGATVSPQNLYLHSALVKTRKIDRTRPDKVREANKYYFIENCISLVIAFTINTFVVSVFATGLYDKTNADILQLCTDAGSTEASAFSNSSDLVVANIYTGGVFLGCKFGQAALYIWAIGILAAGQSSTMTGCYAGQFAMEGFLNLTWSRSRRVMFTRTVAILPTFCVAYFSQVSQMSSMNDLLNTIMSALLPFALIPVLSFTSNKAIMGRYVNSIGVTIAASVISGLLIAINVYYMLQLVINDLAMTWYVIILVVLVTCLYVVLCIYLSLHFLISVGVIKNETMKRLTMPINAFSLQEAVPDSP